MAHHRSESELELASLHLSEYPSSRRPGGQISDDDLEALCPPLGKSAMEDDDERQLGDALRALSLLNRSTPASGSGDVFSPYSASPCPPDAPADNYFHPARPLYSAGHSYGRSSSGSLASTPGSQYSFSSSASSCGPATPEPKSPRMSTIASRRNASKMCLDLGTLPSPSLPSTAPPSKTTRGFESPPVRAPAPPGSATASGHGLLQSNFGGIKVQRLDVDLEGPLTPQIRPRRASGFAF